MTIDTSGPTEIDGPLSGIASVDHDLPALRFVLIGLLIMGAMMFRPQGLLPERKRVYRI